MSDPTRGRYTKTRTSETADISDDEEQKAEYVTDEESANLSAAFSKALGIAGKSDHTRALRRAASALAKLVTGNHNMEEESDTEAETDSSESAGAHHTLIAGECSSTSWNKAVQGVVDSVDTMSKCATGIPVAAGVRAKLCRTGIKTPQMHAISDNPLDQPFTARALEREPALSATTATPVNPIPKERMMTLHPLLLPCEDRFISAHRLTSLYFTAVMDPCDIPEFKAEYVYTEGRCSRILLTFKNVYDVHRLKELWDSAERERTGIPELASVSLYRGSNCTQHADTSVRDAAIEELASFKFRLISRAIF